MPQDIKTTLRSLGLGTKEITVYLSTLKLGEATVSDISYKSSLARTTTASVLERLEQRNLVSSHRQKGKLYFWIEDPKTLEQQVEHQLEAAQLLSSELKNFYHTEGKKPSTQIYDSKVAIQNLLHKTIKEAKKGDEILTWDTSKHKNYNFIVNDEVKRKMVEEKEKKNVQTRTLVPADTAKLISSRSLNQPITIRTLPPGMDYSFSVWIIKNKVVFFSGKIPYAAVIQHPEIVQSMKQWFEFMWEISQPLN